MAGSEDLSKPRLKNRAQHTGQYTGTSQIKRCSVVLTPLPASMCLKETASWRSCAAHCLNAQEATHLCDRPPSPPYDFPGFKSQEIFKPYEVLTGSYQSLPHGGDAETRDTTDTTQFMCGFAMSTIHRPSIMGPDVTPDVKPDLLTLSPSQVDVLSAVGGSTEVLDAPHDIEPDPLALSASDEDLLKAADGFPSRTADAVLLRCEYCKFERSDQNGVSEQVKCQHQDTLRPAFRDERIVSNKHCAQSQSDRSMKSTFCDTLFERSDTLALHDRIHTGQKPTDHGNHADSKPLRREVGEKLLRCRRGLTKRSRTHTDEKLFSCEICEKAFSGHDNLTNHLRTHTGEKPFSCEVCGEAFIYHSVLTRHLLTHTGEKPFSCEVCGKAFSQHGSLTRHLRTHTDEKLLSCEVCGKAFMRYDSLTNHLWTHTDEKPLCCEVCGKAFSQQRNLICHLRMHTGDKPFSCEICGKAFSQRGNLTDHLRTHTDEKPFSCEVCGKAFSYHSVLTRHLLTHTGEKPFSCEVCGTAFSQHGSLTRHLRTHTGETPFNCEVWESVQ
ncbi:zinc finger protein 2-like [Pollicipes pollicipes]|uniref:zinc finger protein 2-like n=1 Tax=Pollicipes pollicipes TaxID=41117 RepID=UPI0018853D1E|nr:zinc finger protein 2-like [Pollicipes pollicipes]